MFCQPWLEKVKGFLLTIYDICFKCQKAACCFQTFTSYKIWFTAMQHKMNIYMVQLFISFCHTYSKQLTRKWPFLWGPRLRSLAAINLTKVNGNSRSFGMLACGRKLRFILRGDAMIFLFIIHLYTTSFQKQSMANTSSSSYILYS